MLPFIAYSCFILGLLLLLISSLLLRTPSFLTCLRSNSNVCYPLLVVLREIISPILLLYLVGVGNLHIVVLSLKVIPL
jgi:hypothetical protein